MSYSSLSKIHRGRIDDNGKLLAENKEEFLAQCLQLKGREVEFTLTPFSNKRTNPENRYYWGVIVKLVADEMGVIPDKAHKVLKESLLKVGVEYKGKRYEITRSTADLKVNEFEDYCERARLWAMSELNLPIPLPNEIIINI